MRRLVVKVEEWPLNEPFIISRMVQEQGDVVVVEIEQDGRIGRGETERADQYMAGRVAVTDEIEAVRDKVEAGITRDELQRLLPSGPARCAVDCALWDLEAKLTGTPMYRLAGLDEPLVSVTTVFTISLDSPEKWEPTQ